MAMTSQGRVYAWGDNSRGQLGLRTAQVKAKGFTATPTHVAALRGLQVVEVGAGASHSMFLSRTGMLQACGSGAQGQLGVLHRNLPVGDIADQSIPQRVDLPGKDHVV
uniref:Uncharacterized protein n=1 Tax=Rhizochromulina marina TaxID=1034831 RepID=A0A7S2STA5_9STRA